MSNRTAAANRAILDAWEREAMLVSKGQGTRDWTPDQQKDILERGKAYDDSGKAFQGQHMKSVEKYPEYQGDPENIQFLTIAEHLEAHRGNWQNPTNWYYDPVTKQFFDFGEGKFVPCKVIELGNPIVDICSCEECSSGDIVAEDQEAKLDIDRPISDSPSSTTTNRNTPTSPPDGQTLVERAINGIKSAYNATVEFMDAHPEVATALEVIGTGLVAYGTGKAIDALSKTPPTRLAGITSPSSRSGTLVKTVADAVSHIDIENVQSTLRQIGYTVAKSVSLSDVDRQKILQKVIAGGVMTKEAVCAYLKFNINMHKNQVKYAEAVGKWITDLAYVTDKL